MTMKKKVDTHGTIDYGSTMAELDAILRELQSDTIALDEALRLHEKGTELLGQLEKYLQQADLLIQKHTVTEEQ